MTLTFGSVCSGIEAASVAWHPLGWRTAFLSEIAPFPRAVLSHHYPDTPLRGDFTEIQASEHDPIDLLVGGTPCQSFSVAGLRRGMADERGNLALEYLRLADRLRPRWLVWENVPGVLSSWSGPQPPSDLEEGAEWEANETSDFGCFLAGLSELGYHGCYRVLDAQYLGLAQRRARVFVVGYLGDWRRAAAVLFEPASLRGHPAPRREAGQNPSPTLSARTGAGGGLGTDHDLNGGLIARCLTAHPSRSDMETENFVATTLRARDQSRGVDSDCTDTLIAHTLRGEGFDASEDGTGRGTPLVAVAASLSAGSHPNSNAAGRRRDDDVNLVSFDLAQITSAANRTRAEPGLPASTLAKQSRMHAATRSAIRRLTPRECERLQGFPDDYTLVPYRKRLAADGPRYQALGNSMATNVMAWIGKRIAAQEADLRATIPMLEAAE